MDGMCGCPQNIHPHLENWNGINTLQIIFFNVNFPLIAFFHWADHVKNERIIKNVKKIIKIKYPIAIH